MKFRDSDAETQEEMYFPGAQRPRLNMSLLVSSNGYGADQSWDRDPRRDSEYREGPSGDRNLEARTSDGRID